MYVLPSPECDMFEGSRTQFGHTHERLGDIKSRSGEISVRRGSGRKKGLYQLPISIDMSIEVHKTLGVHALLSW